MMRCIFHFDRIRDIKAATVSFATYKTYASKVVLEICGFVRHFLLVILI